MTDTDITLLPNYVKMDLARSHAMILTSPPSHVPYMSHKWILLVHTP